MVKETLTQDVTQAFQEAVKATSRLNAEGRAEWGVIKNTHVEHLARLDAFSHPDIRNSGGRYSLNAVRDTHGPSWRMIVQLSASTEAYGIYPGGQDGNPGSPHYDDFVQNWAEGKYYPLWVMSAGETSSEKIHAVFHAVPR
jgi:penicillin G amidase